jgi:tetratricopeptide (TPR) repeat protein
VRLYRKIVQTVADTKWRADFAQYEAVVQAGAAARAGLEVMLPLLEGEPPHLETVRLFATLSLDAWYTPATPDWDAAERYARTAVAVAEQLDAPAELSAALQMLANVYYARGRLRERVQVALQRLALSHDPRFGDPREHVDILNQIGTALMDVGEYAQALSYVQEAERLAGQIHAIGLQVYAVRVQSRCWFQLDRWDDVLMAEPKWRDLERRYTREQVGPTCFEIALTAAIHALRGQFDQAAAQRKEAYAIMAAVSGPPEHWRRNQHY